MGKQGNRGRIVMLVDNGVEGDSRVQKQARSAAQAGWDVVLLGRSPDKKTHRWKFGKARVRLVPMPTPLSKDRDRNEGIRRRYDTHLARARVVDVEYGRNRAAFLGEGSSFPVRAAWRLRREYADRRRRLVERRGTDFALGSGRGPSEMDEQTADLAGARQLFHLAEDADGLVGRLAACGRPDDAGDHRARRSDQCEETANPITTCPSLLVL